MRKILRLSAVTALACIPLTFIGCSDDDVQLGPIGGFGGDGASGGNAGSAAGGRGGTSMSGTGGTLTAGTGGSSGAAGTAGTGGTGNECALTECGTDCVDPETTAAHCGECDRPCSNANASGATCGSGLCSATCNAGFADCNVDDGTGADDGCETDLNQNATCGTACGTMVACQVGEFCVAGECTTTCSDTECGSACVALPTSSDHCNACDRACSSTGVETRACVAGACAPSCNEGFGDCSVDDGLGADDGCETNLNLQAACGTTCGNRIECQVGEFCVDGACTATCDDTVCGTACVDTDTSVTSCGACDRACDSTNTSSLACNGGACEPTCNDGFGDCNVGQGGSADGGGADDGCETDFSSDESCGTSCGDVEACADDESCNDGVCTPDCEFLTCGGQCTDTATAEDHCGACDRACLDDANVTSTTCSAGLCAAACGAGRADCSQPEAPDADDGCETVLNTGASCGTNCGNVVACGSTQACVSGACLNNLVTNSSVESGLAPWAGAQGATAVIATDQFNTGTQSAVTVGRTQGYQGVGVNLFGVVTQGASYNVSGFMRVSAPSTAQGRLTVRADCPGAQYIMSRDANVSSTAWTQFTGTFTVPSAAACPGFSGLNVFFEQADPTLQIYADDLVVTAQ